MGVTTVALIVSRLRVVGGDEGMLGAGGLEIGYEVPKRSRLIVVAY